FLSFLSPYHSQLLYLPSFPTRRSSDLAAIVAPLLHLRAPVATIDVPPRRCGEPLFERVLRQPPELAADFRRVDRVAPIVPRPIGDRKSTRLNSSHQIISYAVFCLKKKR